MSATMRFCSECEHFSLAYDLPRSGRCTRPLKKWTSPVTGEDETQHGNKDCELERSHVSWIARALGNTDCGVEAIHFKPKNK